MHSFLEKLVLSVRRWRKNFSSNINRSAIWVLGNQKSGTTVIASLIAEYGDLSKNIDFGNDVYMAAEDLRKVGSGDMNSERFIRKYRWGFSREVIKEPHLTFLFEEFAPHLPKCQYVFVIRDPRDNIRSILNRVGLPGNKTDIDIEHHPDIRESWKDILLNRGLNFGEGTYIEQLAYRWKYAASLYLARRSQMTAVSYEDFNENKTSVIKKICKQLSIKKQKDISNLVDKQYQPKGDREISWESFFGKKNLHKIESLCGDQMPSFGYEKII